MIAAENISKHFFDLRVLSELNLTVKKNESYVVLGQSGTGKSVLLKILASLLTPDQGKVTLGTENVGMLFQKNALFDSLTVFENLDFTLKERTSLKAPDRRKKSLQFLEWVELTHATNLYPDELSGGMQKRLGVARALIVNPEIILYDEPTAGLDPITSRIIADLILRLTKEFGPTVVTVTSDVHRAYQMADRIGLIVPHPEAGFTLFESGSPLQTKNSSDTRVQQFIKGRTLGPLTRN